MAKREKVQKFDPEKEVDALRKDRYVPANDNCLKHWAPGDRVKRGNIKEAYVVKSYDDFRYYHIHEIVQGNRDTNNVDYERESVVAWVDLDLYRTKEENEKIVVLHEKDDWRLAYQQRDVSGLIHLYYHAGLDMDPEYQREFVWEEEDKVKLIDSIFRNIDIGKFTLTRRDYGFDGPLYEIIDGKQRLRAILDFFEDKFRYKGHLYSELSWADQIHFENHPVGMAVTEKLTEADKMAIFLKLNVGGVPQDPNHILHVKALYIEAKKEGK